VARLRAKPGGEDIEVAIGDFATTRVGGEFSLVYLVFNTIFNLVTQDEQIACFENAAAHRVPLRVARRARPHGAACGAEVAGPVGRVAAGAVHQPQ